MKNHTPTPSLLSALFSLITFPVISHQQNEPIIPLAIGWIKLVISTANETGVIFITRRFGNKIKNSINMKRAMGYFGIFITIGFYCITTSCNWKPANPYSDNGLPPATQVGAETFACRVNGKVWIAKPADLNGIYNHNGLAADGSLRMPYTFQYFAIAIRNGSIVLNKTYDLSDTTLSYGEMRTVNDSCFKSSGGYGGGTSNVIASGGQLVITRADSTKRIVSGTFWFNIPSDYCDTLKITDGRFDIVY